MIQDVLVCLAFFSLVVVLFSVVDTNMGDKS